MKDINNYLKLKVKIKDKFYGVYGEPSNFKAVKYMNSVIVPEDGDYYKIGDVVLVLTFNYTSYLNRMIAFAFFVFNSISYYRN